MFKKIHKALNLILILSLVLSIFAVVPFKTVVAAVEMETENGYLSFEAEDLTYNTERLALTRAKYFSKGAALAVMKTDTAPADKDAPHDIDLSFTADKTGDYAVWVRNTRSPQGVDNGRSVYISVGDTDYAYAELKGGASEEPGWSKIATVTVANAGDTVKLRLRVRQMPNVALDCFIITNKANYEPTDYEMGIAGATPPPEKPSGTGLANPVKSYPALTPREIPENLPTPPASHPRVYISSKNIEEYKAMAEHPSMKPVWDKLVEAASTETTGELDMSLENNYSKEIKNAIEAKALMYVIKGDKEMGQNAVDAAIQYNRTLKNNPPSLAYRNYGNVVSMNAMVYDWCYDLLTKEQKEELIVWIETWAQSMEMGWPIIKQNATVGHGAEYQIQRDMVSAGIAVYDEKKEIYELAAGRVLKEFAEARKFWFNGHYHPQGSAYGVYRYSADISAAFLFDAIGIPNVYGTDQQYGLYRHIYNMRPDGLRMVDGDNYNNGSKFGGIMGSQAFAFLWGAGYFKDSILMDHFVTTSNSFGQGGDGGDYIYDFLFYDPTVEPASPKEAGLPLAKFFPEPLGAITARTSWLGGGVTSNTALVTMDLSTYHFNGHDQADSGHFQVYYKGPLTVDTGIYEGVNGGYHSDHDKNYNKRSIAHNTIQVYDPDEQFLWYSETLANDGGQRMVNNRMEPDNLDSILKDGYKTGEVLAHDIGPYENNPEYAYIKGNLAEAYNSKITDYTRSMVYLNLFDQKHPIALMVYDNVASRRENFKKAWLLHMVDEPQIQGNETTIIAPKQKGYNGKMVNTTLLPAQDNLEINKVGSTDNQYSVFGTNYPQSLNDIENKAEDNSMWRIEVSPKNPSREDTFFNVMQVMDDIGGPEKLNVNMIDSPKMTGASIADRVVFFSKTGETIGDKITFDLTGEGTLKVLVTDVKDGFWSVSKNGESATVQYTVKKDAGALYFYGEAGSYTLTYSEAKTLGDPPAFPEPPAEIVDDSIKVMFNGLPMYFDVQPQTINDRTMVPFRAIFEALGAEIEWDDVNNIASGIKDDLTVSLTIDSEDALINGEIVELDVAATVIDGRTLVPVRFIAENFGAKVDWIEETKTVVIEYDERLDGLGVTVTTSEEAEPDYGVKNAFDGDLSTRFALLGQQWIMFTFDKPREISSVGLAWIRSHERSAIFKISISENGTDFTTVFDGKQKNNTDDFYYYTFPKTKVKAVKIDTNGTTAEVGGWTSLLEVDFR